MRKLVSIIMPVYNSAGFVKEAIQSVLDQSHPDWELIIVNDGSTDDSVREISQFEDERIRIFNQENKGVSSARNIGLEQMNGEYFCFLDADDVLTPRSLESRLSLFDESIGFVDGSVDLLSADLKHRKDKWTPKASGQICKSLFRLDRTCFVGLTWMIRRQPNVNYRFDESLTHCEDLLFLMSIAHTGNYTFTRKTILNYRRTPGSAMRNIAGLARGYTLLGERMRLQFSGKLSLFDRLVYEYKVRRIIFLSFLRLAQLRLATRYLIKGTL